MLPLLQKLLDILVPEEGRLGKLLSLEPALAYRLLPKSNLNQRGILALFDYQNKMVRLLVRAVKFKNNPQARRLAADFLYEGFVDLASDTSLFEGSTPILIPVPMSKGEKKSRGYNQCEELAREIQKISGDQIQVEYNLLQKIRNTDRQVHLTKEERIKNLKNCMQVFDPEGILKNKNIILLDDIHTTGSTFLEARRALLAAYAHSVSGLFLAH